MTFGSLFSGIGGFDLALERTGFACSWQCEIDKAASSVLANHWPNVKNIGDVRNVRRDTVEPVDLICGGFPCQDLSVAGKRAGLAGERSGLWFEFARVIEELRPGWVVIENVPGLLSSNGGRDFAVILNQMVEFGYGVAWRVLDAQYFGVAQRRRRVFIVGSLGNGRAAEVLFERESGPGDTAPSRKKGQRVARTLNGISNKTGGSRPPGSNLDTVECLIAASETGHGYFMDGIGALRAEGENRPSRPSTLIYGGNNTSGPIDVATAVNASGSRRYDFESETFVAFNIQQNDGGDHKRKDRPNGGMYVSETETALTVGSVDLTVIANGINQSGLRGRQPGIAATFAINSIGVRRLTPTECERLQGFPDGWTAGQSDSARYRQLGNAVAVPVVEWIARRIAEANT